MSYRDRLRPVSTVDQSNTYSPTKRAPSNASTISSAYSNSSFPSEISRTSTISSSASSNYSNGGHRRGKSEAATMAPSALSDRFRHLPSFDEHPDSSFKSARLSLRPLSQAPNNSPPMTSRPKTSSYSHVRSQTVDATHDDPFTEGRPKTSYYTRSQFDDFEPPTTSLPSVRPKSLYSQSRNEIPDVSPNTPPGGTRPKLLHSHGRGQSVDVSQSPSRDGSPITPPHVSKMRPQSMLLSRADSVMPGSPQSGRGHSYHTHSPLAPPDLQSLQKSSTGHLKTLSKFAQNASADEFTIKSPEQEVVGLHGRRRLKADSSAVSSNGNNYGWSGRNWMDKQRQFLQAYEYLCHIGEAKEWIEDIIHKPIPPIVQLEEALRDGVTLAEIVEALYPDRRVRIFRHPKLQFRHSDNIATFFNFLGEVELPDLFRFELIDLYEKKNIPKVIYCIHALSWLLYRKGIVDFRIGNLVGQLEFEHDELEAMQKGLDKAGVSMPSFGNMGASFGVEPAPEPEPVESEEERIERELQEERDRIARELQEERDRITRGLEASEAAVVELQAQARGALMRMQLSNTMQQLWDAEHSIVDLQSRIRGDFARQISEYRLTMRRFATNLQSASRGFLVRQRQASRESFWKSREGDVLKLQSIIRAKKVRDEIRALRSELRHETFGVTQLQAAIRGALLRKAMDREHEERITVDEPVKNLQAAIMGMLLRNRISADMERLTGQEAAIISLQAAARAISVRNRVASQLEALEASSESTTALQSACRGMKLRAQLLATRKELNSHAKSVTDLQSFIRASFVRDGVNNTLTKLESENVSITKAQSSVRGMLLRGRLAADREALDAQVSEITKVQSYSRGLLLRKRNKALLADLQSNVERVIQLQSLGRAMLLRNDVGALLGELEAEEESIIAFQAAAQACLVRARFAEKQRFFRQNMGKVVKIQSFVRGRLQGEAYKSLTTGKNPPVNTVKNFVHLLNDSDFDFNEEIEFERLRKTVVQQVRQNEMAEQYIDQLDIKIALLVKNKITLDEVVRHQKNYGGHSSNLLTSNSLSSGNQDLKALNKNSRKKLESYQQLFFTLQTQPQYLARMFRRIREQGTAEKDCRRIETLMMGLFGYAQKRREEYYLLKLIARSVREEVERCRTVQDYLRGNFFWSKLLANYTRSPRDRKYLRELLGPLIRDNIVEDPELDLESDPMQIYRSVIGDEELRTGQPSRRPLEVPREMAIKDEETRALFIDHLRDLREISDQFLTAFEELLHRMPYGIRFITQQAFEALCDQFPREPQENLLQIVGNWVWKFYLLPALTSPEQVGVIEKVLDPLQKRNLSEVGKVLSQVALGKLFGGDNIYLQPLNAYVENAIARISLIFDNLINVPDAESTFDIDEFNDLYSKSKPTLYIKMVDIFAIHNLVAGDLPEMCPGRDDMLREIILELGSAKNNENELLGVTSAEIQMTLTPKLHEVEDPEADIKTLFMETKRCVLYIIRIQAGPNLMDILVRPVTEEDEEKWYGLLQEEFSPGSNSRGAYADANTLVDITAMSYAELKRSALENIMHLEHTGRISRHNQYQDLLNAIAMDIRTKSRRRIQRQRELEGVRLTLGNLNDKAVWLEQQRKSYDNYIEQAMLTLQNKRGKKRFLLPFTKQYNHERELQRSGRKPKFGSYKYSARTLADKGVLISWQGYDSREWDRINLTISCDEVGVFFLEGSKGSIQIPGASAQVPMDDLLQAQFNNHQFMNLFEGGVRLNVNLFLHLLYKKFYRTE